MLYSIQTLLVTLVNLYVGLIIIYTLMSWLPNQTGWVAKVYNFLHAICEPYLALFRRIIPPIGMIDISPIVAIIVLQVAVRLLAALI